ncbi:MAG: PIN domain-containing protein [Gammaproteobacteria bacterium]
MRTNYILVDYENVQPEALAQLDAEHFKVIVFVGASQTKVTFEAAKALQQMGEKAQYIQISGNGPNALDFHIAFYIGQLAKGEPMPYFHILSKDTGFDPLIKHLNTKGIQVSRSRDIKGISIVKVANLKSLDERLNVIVSRLQRLGVAKPRTVKTLSSTVNSMFQKQLSDQELAALIKGLENNGWIEITGTKVSYSLPG